MLQIQAEKAVPREVLRWIRKWSRRMSLPIFYLYVGVLDKPASEDGDSVGETYADPFYARATIRVAPNILQRDGEFDEIPEQVVLHELCHVLVSVFVKTVEVGRFSKVGTEIVRREHERLVTMITRDLWEAYKGR